MADLQAVGVLTPVARVVQGSIYEAQTVDQSGKPLLIKNGPNAGQPTKRWFFAIAIPKEPGGQHWAYTAWGKTIWDRGHTDFPQGQADKQDFAWKIIDGDSTVSNENNKVPANQTGFKGCWVMRLQSGFPPKTVTAKGDAVLEPGVIKPGYWVQVYLTCSGNDDGNRNPGVFLNPSIVALAGYGEEISFGPDAAAVGFGAASLPPGASAVPVAAYQPPAATGAAPPGPTPPPVSMPATQHPAMGVAGKPPGAAPPPPGPAAHQMTVKAAGVSYEDYKAAGWSDEQLVAHGMMTA